jgi:hypothetical protein
MVDCTEAAEDIITFCGYSNDPSGCRTNGKLFDRLRNYQITNEQIRQPKGVLQFVNQNLLTTKVVIHTDGHIEGKVFLVHAVKA